MDLCAAAADLVARSTTHQGLPATVADPAVIGRVAALLQRDEAPPKRGLSDLARRHDEKARHDLTG